MTPARSAPVLANTSEPVERLEVDVDATTAAYLHRRCVPAVTWPAPQPQSCTTSPCATRPPRSPATTSRAKPSCWPASRTPTQPSPSWRPEYARAEDHLTPTRRCQTRCRGRHGPPEPDQLWRDEEGRGREHLRGRCAKPEPHLLVNGDHR